jgi:hypothetical protein
MLPSTRWLFRGLPPRRLSLFAAARMTTKRKGKINFGMISAGSSCHASNIFLAPWLIFLTRSY